MHEPAFSSLLTYQQISYTEFLQCHYYSILKKLGLQGNDRPHGIQLRRSLLTQVEKIS
jgi:hypothetical protein